MLKPVTAGGPEAGAGNSDRAPSVRRVLAALSLPVLLSSLGISIANVGLPTLAEAFDASFQEVQWIVIAYLLAVTTLIVGVGRLGDMVGRRRLLLAGIALFTLASALSGFAPTLGLLIAARAAQGLGAAVMMALAMALVGETVPKAKTGSAMGLLGTMSAIGTALGPSLGGLLIAGIGWQAIFQVKVPLGLLTLYLAHRHLPLDRQGPKTDRSGFDSLGMLLLALTLAAYALAMTLGRGGFGALNGVLLAAAAIGAALFVRTEARVATPLVRLAMLRDPVLTAGLATTALVSTVMMTTLVVGPFFLSHALGLDAMLVGLVLSVGPLVAALSGVPAGRLVDRFGTQRMTVVGLTGIAVRIAGDARDTRICRFPRCRHRGLRAVPGGQQHRRHGGCRAGPAGRRLRPAQPVAQSRADHRRFSLGRGVRIRLGDDRYRDRDADRLCRRGGLDRRRARHRGRQPGPPGDREPSRGLSLKRGVLAFVP